jgi:ech hydrogenase subunit D
MNHDERALAAEREERQSVVDIDAESLLKEVDSLRAKEWRIVQVLCVSNAEGYELSYSFGLGLRMKSLRLRSRPEEEVPSVTALYPGAFLYENEIRDLFGVRIERIRADWEGNVLDVAQAGPGGRPFSKVRIEATSSEEPRV